MPYNVEALQHIANYYDLVEAMNIVPMGDTPVQRMAKTAKIMVITDHMCNMIWLPMDVTTLDYVTNNHEMIEDMQIVEGYNEQTTRTTIGHRHWVVRRCHWRRHGFATPSLN